MTTTSTNTPPADSRFIVTCHGWSASNWLAHALHCHPRISCAHSAAAILAEDPAIFDGVGLKTQLPRVRAGYLQRQSRAIDALYADLAHQHPAAHIGTVHTYRLRDLPVQADRFPPRDGPYRVVNLLRHPLDLVVSGYGQFRDLFAIDLNEFSWTLAKIVDQGLEIVETICDAHDLRPGSYDVLCFFGACVVLGSLRLDLDALDQISDEDWHYLGAVRMEEITTDPAALARLIAQLTDQPGLADQAYLDQVFRKGRINVHNAHAARGTQQRWHDLAPWQQQGFAAFLDHFALRAPYTELGYDFSFLDIPDAR